MPLCAIAFCKSILGGSWEVTSRIISRVTIPIPHIRGLTTPLITTHEPPSTGYCTGFYTDYCKGFDKVTVQGYYNKGYSKCAKKL